MDRETILVALHVAADILEGRSSNFHDLAARIGIDPSVAPVDIRMVKTIGSAMARLAIAAKATTLQPIRDASPHIGDTPDHIPLRIVSGDE
jgi:hypothetical protein